MTDNPQKPIHFTKKVVKFDEEEPQGLARRARIADRLRSLSDDRQRQIQNLVELLNILDNRENIRASGLQGFDPMLIYFEPSSSTLGIKVQGRTHGGKAFEETEFYVIFNEPNNAKN